MEIAEAAEKQLSQCRMLFDKQGRISKILILASSMTNFYKIVHEERAGTRNH
jgi:hypothetical protein